MSGYGWYGLGRARTRIAELAEEAAQPGDGGQQQPWPEEPDLPRPPDPDPLPLDTLPPALRAHVESVAAATQTPPDMGAMIALAAVSAAVSGRAVVHVDARAWREPVHIYTAVILPPATRKSAVHAAHTAPIRGWEAEQQEEVGPAYRRALVERDVAQAALTAAKAAAAKRNCTMDEVEALRLELESAEAAVPVLPRVLASDATPEALVRLMAEQRGRISLVEPEADPLGMADGRYSDGARIDELLRAWSGEPIRVDRVAREPIHIRYPAVTLGLALQPAALEALEHARVHRGRGLYGRILWCAPQHGLGKRRTGRDVPALDTAATNGYDRILRLLLDCAGFARADAGPRVLTIAEDALEILYRYEAEVEPELADQGRLAGIRDWAGKVCGQAVRVAALVSLAARAEQGGSLWEQVDAEAMDAGVRLARALSTHALAVLGEMGTDRHLVDLGYVLRRARDLPPQSTLRDLHDATRDRPGIGTMDDLRPITEELVERGCMRLVDRRRSGPGRPPSPQIELHPAFAAADPKMHPQNPHNPLSGQGQGNTAGITGVNRGSWSRGA